MKLMRPVVTAVLALALTGPACAQHHGSFGAGVILGDPTGLTLKTWVDDRQAFDVGVGFSGDAAFYADYLLHAWDVLPQPSQGRLGAYLGLGPRVETQRDATFGIRTLGGVDYWIANRPIELFLEAGPVFRLAPERQVDVDAGLGVRLYFGGSKS
ncbi:MAG: hypothetical protein HY921_06985 [Elusimicrobia bacterium]|nr:hypothetical protein [Elusimicrobiota bacterium]